ncbi:phosphate ABC transporter substrate-binding protein PstS [Georgenia sp. EYE_87]|uniref:phosphate ABC transporter substrate-binding protein PstS n=1 Tax=Georgenia sp. EYE_87 TaxID=2853448 RepID=UPI00200551DE|nr:phosphate ABC transporter substrate-binding protein PstS [Georgenia sp. EYE_87]MCK6209716.1 phosphate ABC transporter substrate-binding protein PstS [Georgenia sp. EYE_87]
MTVKLAGSRRMAGVAAISALAITLAACGGSEADEATEAGGEDTAAELSGTLPGAGASSQENAMNGWLAGFTEQYPDVQASYDPVGSGTGREQFINGATLFGGTDSKFDEEELAAGAERCYGGEVVELPLYISPIAVAYNLPGVEAENLNLEPETLAAIFNGDITRWNDPAIAESNPDVELPDLDIVPVNRSDDSGTTENFTEYLAAAAGDAWPHEASETWPISGTQSGAQTSGVVSTLQAAEGTIAYLDASQVPEGFGTVAVGVGEEFVPFSPEAAAAVVDASPAAEDATDLRLTIDLARDTEESGAYPIVLVSYTMACSVYETEQDAENVKALLTYIASEEGQQRAADPTVAGSAPISEDLRTKVTAAIEQISVA